MKGFSLISSRHLSIDVNFMQGRKNRGEERGRRKTRGTDRRRIRKGEEGWGKRKG